MYLCYKGQVEIKHNMYIHTSHKDDIHHLLSIYHGSDIALNASYAF